MFFTIIYRSFHSCIINFGKHEQALGTGSRTTESNRHNTANGLSQDIMSSSKFKSASCTFIPRCWRWSNSECLATVINITHQRHSTRMCFNHIKLHPTFTDMGSTITMDCTFRYKRSLVETIIEAKSPAGLHIGFNGIPSFSCTQSWPAVPLISDSWASSIQDSRHGYEVRPKEKDTITRYMIKKTTVLQIIPTALILVPKPMGTSMHTTTGRRKEPDHGSKPWNTRSRKGDMASLVVEVWVYNMLNQQPSSG